jgi:hypothetical protein
MDGMGILDNIESAWDEEFHFESKPIVETDQKGDPVTWENSNQ